MTTIQQTSIFNVEATLQKWLRAQLATVTLPTWLPSLPTIYSNAPEAAAVYPCFSMAFFDVDGQDVYQGRNVGSGLKGTRQVGLWEVSAWATRTNTNWEAKLRTMHDMVMTVINGALAKAIEDYAADAATHTATTYLIRFTAPPRRVPTAPDPNPDIERRRLLTPYSWIYRTA